LEVSTVDGVIEFVESRYLHVTSVVGVTNGGELSSLMVKESDVAILGIAQVSNVVSSLERGVSSSLVGEVLETGEVHQESSWASIWVESSWHNLGVSVVDEVTKLVVSWDLHLSILNSIGNSWELSVLLVVEHGLWVLTSGQVVDLVLTSEAHNGILVEIVKLGEVHEHELGWWSIRVEGSWHNLGVSIVGEILEFVISWDLHLSILDGVGNSGELTILLVVEHGLGVFTSGQVVDLVLTSESHNGILVKVVEWSEVDEHFEGCKVFV
jgi:hypothetical protein